MPDPSPAKAFYRSDVWQVVEKVAMCFVATCPIELFTNGFSWKALAMTLGASILMACQMTARQWVKDNRVPLSEVTESQTKQTQPPIRTPWKGPTQ